MTQKNKNMRMHLFYCLCQLLLWNLDELKVTTARMIKLKQDLTEFCQLLNDECANTYKVQKTTYFQELTMKINTIVRRTFDQNM